MDNDKITPIIFFNGHVASVGPPTEQTSDMSERATNENHYIFNIFKHYFFLINIFKHYYFLTLLHYCHL